MFLVDSGQRKLYKALCAQIKANNNKKIESPEKDATPDYYRNSTYHAWFKFTSITECVEDELRNYSLNFIKFIVMKVPKIRNIKLLYCHWRDKI